MRIVIYFLIVLLPFSALSQTATFTTSKDQDCNILKVTLDASGSGGIGVLTYFWDFGNGNQTSGTDKAIVEAIYVQPGNPLISLYVTDASGNKSQTFTKAVKILSGPQIDFSGNPSASCSGKPISLINNTQPGSSSITGYIWNIGNEISSTDESPSHVFSNTGEYDVTLTVTDANGCNVSLKKEKLISIRNNFAVNFSADNTFDCAIPFTTHFHDNTDYSLVSGHQFSYLWNFGEGSVSISQNPSKVYNSIGTYQVSLMVLDNTDGCSSSLAVQDFISAGGRKPKVAIEFNSRQCNDFLFTIRPNSAGLPAVFKKTVDLGDGTIDTSGQVISHTYSRPGKYVVKATYANPLDPSCIQTGADTLIVPELGEEMTADKTSSCNSPMTVKFSLKNISDGAFYKWDFGDGTFSQQAAPEKVYTGIGKYTVKVKVWSKSGCTYELEKKDFIDIGKRNASFTSDARRIQELPNEFSLHPLQDSSALVGGCIPYQVNFTNTTPPGTAINFVWDFGDGDVQYSTQSSISHTYTSEGVYTPRLIAIDAGGCTDTFTCAACVRAGKPPLASIVTSGPDTVCCLYDKTFASNVNLNDVDLLWYNVVLNDGSSSSGITMAYYKDSTGKWIMEDNTTSQYQYSPPGLGLRYSQTNFALPTGNQPDFYFYAYKNGCPEKVFLPQYQKHLLPWGTFAPLSCAAEENLKGGDTLDFNVVGGNWILGLDQDSQPMKLSKAVVTFAFSGQNGCTMPEYSQTYTPSSLGFEMSGQIFEKIRSAGLFPKIAIPSCASKGDELLTSTYLYTHDDAQKYYHDKKCLCEEHWPYKIGSPSLPDYLLSAHSGCAPLNIKFDSNSNKSIKWIFDDGTTLMGNHVSYNFKKPGKYKFRLSTNDCAPAQWQDSIEVFGPVAKFKANQNVFCLNNDPGNKQNKNIELTDSSYGRNDSLETWYWSLGNGKTITKNDGGKVTYNFDEKDLPAKDLSTQFISLTVKDHHGCGARDSIKVTLRKTFAALSIDRTTGCYDTLKMYPLYPAFGDYDPFIGTLNVTLASGGKNVKVYEKNISELIDHPVLLNSNGTYNVHMEILGDALGSCYSSIDTSLIVNYESLSPGYAIPGQTRFSCIPALVEARDSSQQWNERKLKSWKWTFTNNVTHQQIAGSGKVPSPFALVDSGYYSLYYEVQDELGCTKALWKDSVIYINELKGKIDSLPSPLCPGESGLFKGSSTNADHFFWDFGDGMIGEGLTQNHKYTFSGDRNISFIITDSSNCRKSYTGKITVKPGPVFDLGNDTTICKEKKLTLTGPLKYGYLYNWSTGEDLTSITIAEPGVYWLQVKDQVLNCAYTDSLNVQVSNLPYAKILPIEAVCKGESITLHAEIDSAVTSQIWKRDGMSTGTQPFVTMQADEVHMIELEVFNKNFCSFKDQYTLPVINAPLVSLKDQTVCPGDSIVLVPEITYQNPVFKYQWIRNDQKDRADTLTFLLVKTPGKYTLNYGKKNCNTVATASLNFHVLPDTATNERFVIFCEEYGNILLDGGTANTYAWYPDNFSQRYMSISKVGNYVLRIENEFGCYINDTIGVENRCAPKLYVPNAFTPEIEGGNQIHTIYGYNIGSFELLIFNRWGEVIYESKDIKKPWNGYYRNELMPSGVYSWVIKYSGNNPHYTEAKQLDGKVVLVR